MHLGRSPLNRLANPSAVAVIGASPGDGTVGGGLTANLIDGGFCGPVFLVNPSHREIGGYPCHPSLADLPPGVDLALIATPAATLPAIIDQCGERRVKAAVIYSAGFSE